MSETPGRSPDVTDDELLEVFRMTSDPVLTTAEIAENFDITHRGIRDRLEKLEQQGDLKSKKAGARALVWWDPSHISVSNTEPSE